jgi:hypothetical protein
MELTKELNLSSYSFYVCSEAAVQSGITDEITAICSLSAPPPPSVVMYIGLLMLYIVFIA